MVCPVFVWISVLRCAALRFVLKGFRLRLVHTVFIKHDFINNNPVEQRQSARGSRFQRQFPVLQLLQACPLSTKIRRPFFYMNRWNVLVIDDVHLIGRDKGGLCVLWKQFQVKEGGGVFDKTVCWRERGTFDSTLFCVKLSSMLFTHAYEICLIFGPI